MGLVPDEATCGWPRSRSPNWPRHPQERSRRRNCAIRNGPATTAESANTRRSRIADRPPGNSSALSGWCSRGGTARRARPGPRAFQPRRGNTQLRYDELRCDLAAPGHQSACLLSLTRPGGYRILPVLYRHPPVKREPQAGRSGSLPRRPVRSTQAARTSIPAPGPDAETAPDPSCRSAAGTAVITHFDYHMHRTENISRCRQKLPARCTVCSNYAMAD